MPDRTAFVLVICGALAAVLACCAETAGSPPHQPAEEPSLEDWDSRARPRWKKLALRGEPQKWFQVYRVTPHVMAIHEPGHWEHVSSYLIQGTERAILFDSGLGVGNLKTVVDGLLGGKPVTLVNSHSHYDHVGGNAAFKEARAYITDFTRENRRGIPRGSHDDYMPTNAFLKEKPDGFVREEWEIRPWKLGKSLTDGEILDLGGVRLEVIHAPGHASDQICLFDRANRVLLTGDFFYLGPIFAQLRDSDPDAYVQTAARLAKLDDHVDWLLPGHSPPMREKGWLKLFHRAWAAIADGTATYKVRPGLITRREVRSYPFREFWILVRHS